MTPNDILALLKEALNPPFATRLGNLIVTPWSPTLGLMVLSDPGMTLALFEIVHAKAPLGPGSLCEIKITLNQPSRTNLVGAIGALHVRSKRPPSPLPNPWTLLDIWNQVTKPVRPPLPWKVSSTDLHDARLDGQQGAALTVFMTADGTWRWRTSKPAPTSSPTEYESIDAAKAAAEDFAYRNLIPATCLATYYDLEHDHASDILSDGSIAEASPCSRRPPV